LGVDDARFLVEIRRLGRCFLNTLLADHTR
jgi:hypothetical protein